jgi:cytochrome b subunit of formate dehydrogenase
MKEKVPVLLALLMILLMGVSGVIFMRYLEVSEQNRVLREELLQATGDALGKPARRLPPTGLG